MRARVAAAAAAWVAGWWRAIILTVIALVLLGGSYVINAYAIEANNHKFCQVIDATTAVPVPRPADPAANPSREQSYQWYARFARLGRNLGC